MNNDLFGELSEEEKDAQSVLRMAKASLGRANKVIEHWKDMAETPRYENGNWLMGDCLNPLANREHDALWEAGDGNEVAAAVRHRLRQDVRLARLVVNDDAVKPYVGRGLLTVARQVIAKEASHTFEQTMAENIKLIEGMKSEGLNVEAKVVGANCLVSEQKLHGFISEQEMHRSYAVINEAAYPGQSMKEAEGIAASKGQYGVVEPDKEYAGQVLGVTAAHVVVSVGRSAVIAEKGMLNICPEKGDIVAMLFKNGNGLVIAKKEPERNLGR